MAKKFKVLVNTGKAESNESLDVTQGQGALGQPLRIKAQAGAKYQLQDLDKAKGMAPQNVKVKRVGKNLHLLFEESQEADVIIEGYYEVMPDGYNAVLGQAENGNFYEYIPEDPNVKGLIPELADGGQAVSVALGGSEVLGSGAAVGLLAVNPLLGALGLAGAGAGAAALVNAAGTGPVPSPAVNDVAISLNPIAGDNIVNVAEGNQTTTTLSGKVTGAFSAGDIVTLNLNGKTLSTTVAADGSYSFILSTTDIKTDSDTKAEVSVAAKDPVTGNITTATSSQDYAVETQTTAGKTVALYIDTVTSDNLINSAEAGFTNTVITGKVTGVFALGDTVTLSLNGKTFSGVVNAQGAFNINVPTADLLADPDTQIEGSVTTRAGTANAVQNYGVDNGTDTTPPVASVVVDNITPDNLISAQEAGQATLPVTGKVTGEFRPGDVVTVSLNGKPFTGTLDAGGNFSVNVPMVDLLADPDTQLEVTVAVTDGAGNTSNAGAIRDYNASVNPGITSAVILNPVTGDNIISPTEGIQTNVNLTGKVTGPFSAGDAVTVNLNNKTLASSVNAAGEFTVSVLMADLKADADKTVQVSVLAKDPITGQLQSTQNSQTYAVESVPSTGTALVVNPVTADNLLNKVEAQSTNTPVTGKVTGVFAVNDRVTLQVNDKTFTGLVDAQGNFSVNVPTTDLLADADTQINASVTATTPGGSITANAVQNYGVDTTTPVASVALDNITPDNLISAQEAGQTSLPVTGKVTGEFRAGDVVTLSVNDKTFTAAVDAQGNFSVNVPTVDLLVDPNTQLEVSVAVTDGAGNTSNATDDVDYNAQVQGNPPVNTVPAAQTTLEDTNKVITGLQVSDVDAANSTMTVTLAVTNGTLTLLASNGVNIATNNTGSVQLTGTLSAINTLLATANAVTYKPLTNFSGSATLTMTSSDGTFSDIDTVAMTITAVNDAPTGTSKTITMLQGASTSFSPSDFGFADAFDTPANTLSAVIITALPAAGTLKLSGQNVTEGQVIAAANLGNLVYAPAPNANGVGYAAIGFKVQDNGGTANAGSDTSTTANTLTFNVTNGNTVAVLINEPVLQNLNGTLTVSGTGSIGALITVTGFNNVVLGTATVQGNGTWSLTSAGPVLEGTLTANASLNGGNATDTAPYVDDKPPVVNIIEPVTQNADGTLTVSGTSEPGAKIQVTGFAGVLVGTTTVLQNGTWSVTSTAPVKQGLLTATATDINQELATDTAPYADNKPPAVQITEPVVQNPNGTLTVEGTSEPGATIVVKGVNNAIIGTTTVLLNGTWKLTSLGPVPEGTLTATATDINGEVATDTAPYVDNKPPVVNITEPVVQNPNGTLTVSGTGEPGATVAVTGPAPGNTPLGTATVQPNGTWSLTSPGPVPEGTLTATATDINGETGTDTAPYVDNKPPVVNITEPVVQNPNGTLTVSGTGEPGATVAVTGPAPVNTPLGTATVGPNGTWSLTSPGPVPEGTLTATATDINGETGTDTAPYVDNKPPLVNITEPVVQNPNGTLTVSGTGEPGATVAVTGPAPGNTPLGTATVGPNGTWSLTSPGPVPEGTLTATATDINGETGTDTAPYVDNKPPLVNITEPVVQNPNGTLTVSGTGEPGATVAVTGPAPGNTPLGTATVQPNGTWSLTSPGTVPFGTLTATATDINGETGTDTAPYTEGLAISNLDAKDTDGDGKPTVSGQVNKPNQLVTITDPAGGTHTVTTGPDGKFSLELDPAPNPLLGTYTATAVNGADTATQSVIETDLTAPVITNLDAKDTDGDGKPTVSGVVDTPNAVVTITDPAGGTHTVTAGPDGNFSLELDPAPNPLLGTYTAKAVDAAGNTSLPVSVTETDLTAPLVTNVDVVDNDGDGKPTVSGQTEPNLVVTITDPAGGTHTVTAGPDGKFSLEISPAPNPLTGPYTVTAVDPSGNTSLPVTVIETDLTAPVITNLDAKDTDGDGKPTVSGVVDTPNAVVTITDPAGGTHTVTAGPDGNFSLELDPAPNPLLGTYTAKAVDAAGNTSLPVSVTETDLTAPLVTNVAVGDSDGDGKPTVSGQTEPNLVVTITDPAGVIHTVTAGPNGTFTLEIDPAPSPLNGPYTVTAVDPAGNTSAPVSVQLGTATPVLINEPVTQNANGTITVTGTGEQGANIEVKEVNNVLVGTATVLPNGTWSLTSLGEVPAGQLTATSTNLNQQITTDTAPYNNTPVAVLDVAQGTEDSTTLTGNVSTNDTHKDGTETYELMSSATGSHGGLVFNPLNGAWTYTRTANLNAIQTAAIDTFTYKVKDAAGKESTAQLKITLDPVNDAPMVTYSTAQKATYFENADPVVAISVPIVLSDVDSANLSGATVRVANFSTPNAFMPGDLLSFTLPANSPISGSYDTNTGILTFTGTATVAQYEVALSSVKYAHNKDDYATDGNRKVFWAVTDEGGLASSNPPFSWIVVKKLNDAPVLSDTDLALPDIQPLSTASLPTDASKFALGITTNLLVGGVSDADGASVDKGIAIVGVNTSMGTLYLSSDGGSTWATPGFEVSASNAILLRSQSNRRIYFQPHVGVEATIADALTIRAWDTSNNVVESVNGLQVLGYPITTVGGTSPYSSTTDTVSLTVATLASAPAFNGTSGDDLINGSIGADVILAKGGIDQINAGDGHDKIVVNASNVQSLSLSNAANLDGGTGINTLKLTGADMFLDLTNVTVQSKVNHFSALDITGNGANTLKLDLPTVQGLSGTTDNPATASVDESKMLVVQANQGDAVVLENTRNWASLSGLSGESLTTLYGPEYGFIASHNYTQFSQSGATLFVDELAPVGDIVGTSGNDTLTGTANADVIYGNGGVDTIAAGAGKDTVILTASSLTALAASTNSATVDGGADINTLKLSGNNLNLDLTNVTVMGKLDNFNVIDMKQGSGNKFKLGLNDVLALAGGADNAATVGVDESKMLVLQGNGGTALNTLQLVDPVNWTAVTNLGGTGLQNTYGPDFGFEAGRSYTQYTSGSANLFVDEALLPPMA